MIVIILVVTKNCDIFLRCRHMNNKNILSYEIMLGIGICFGIMSGLLSILMKKISTTIIVGTLLFDNCYVLSTLSFFSICDFFSFVFVLLFSFLVVSIAISAIACVAVNFFTGYYPIVVSFILFLGCCITANIIFAVGVNLFPTTQRGMATSFILMFGRLGSFIGGSIVGVLLENSCTSIFYLNATLLIGTFIYKLPN